MWLAADSFAVLIAAQVLAGAIWAAYELATLLLFFETIPAEKRVGVLTAFNLANAAAIVLGSTIGGAAPGLLRRQPCGLLGVVRPFRPGAGRGLLLLGPRHGVSVPSRQETTMLRTVPGG